MKTHPAILITLLFVGCTQVNHKIIDKYPNGQKKIEYLYPDKGDTSKYACFYYYENGHLKHQTQIMSGQFIGNKISYNENGRIVRIETLSRPTSTDDSLYDCHIINYRPDGTKVSEYDYLNNNIEGLATDYDSTEKVIRTADYRSGKMNGKETLYYQNGNIKSLAFIRNDTLDGFYIYFKENGDTLKWFNNHQNGLNGMFYKKWLENSQVLTGNYGDTLRTYVRWTWFDISDKIVKTQIDKSPNEKFIAPE